VELPFITGSKPTARAVCTSLSVAIGLLAAMSAAEAQTSDSVENLSVPAGRTELTITERLLKVAHKTAALPVNRGEK